MNVCPEEIRTINRRKELNLSAKGIEITMEFFHPAGPVTYTTLNDVVFEEAPEQLFTMVFRDEWRKV